MHSWNEIVVLFSHCYSSRITYTQSPRNYMSRLVATVSKLNLRWELICIINASLTKDLLAHPSVVLGSVCSSIVKSIMREGFLRCKSLRWIKVYQPSNKILEVRVKDLHISSNERFTRVLLTKTVPKRFQHLTPKTVAKVPQKHIKAFRVRKVRNLAFKNVGQC